MCIPKAKLCCRYRASQLGKSVERQASSNLDSMQAGQQGETVAASDSPAVWDCDSVDEEDKLAAIMEGDPAEAAVSDADAEGYVCFCSILTL